MKSAKGVVFALLLVAAVAGKPDKRAVPKPVSDCNLEEQGLPSLDGLSSDQLVHCWNR